MYSILVCDDEKDIVSALKIYLMADGYQVFEAYNGKEALEVLKEQDIHLVLMDIMMPEMDGIAAMVKIRETSNVPVILLTAKSEDTDKVLGLTVGADDYITKPFNPIEVQARVKSQLRRYMQLGGGAIRKDVLSIGGIELDDRSKEVSLDGEKISLTRTEYDILKLLMEHPGEVFSPNQIYEQVWQDNPYGTENTVAVHIRHLREKVEYNPAEPRYLKLCGDAVIKWKDRCEKSEKLERIDSGKDHCWIALSASALCFVFSAVGVIFMFDEGIYRNSKDETRKQWFENVSYEYGLSAVDDVRREQPAGSVESKYFKYGIIKADSLEGIDLNDEKSYAERNFSDKISLEDVYTNSVELSDEDQIVYTNGNFLTGGGVQLMYSGDNSWVSVYADRVCYDEAKGVFVYLAGNEYYPVQTIETDIDGYGSAVFTYDTERKMYLFEHTDGTGDAASAERTVTDETLTDAVSVERMAADVALTDAADGDTVAESTEEPLTDVTDSGMDDIANGEYVTFDMFDGTRMDVNHWGNVLLDGVREISMDEIDRVDSSEKNKEDASVSYTTHEDYYLDSNYTLWVNMGNTSPKTTYQMVVILPQNVGTDWNSTDLYVQANTLLNFVYSMRYTALVTMFVSFIIGAAAFVFLMCAAGHRNGTDEIVTTVWDHLWLDVFAVGAVLAEVFVFYVAAIFLINVDVAYLPFILFVTAVATLCMGWLLLLFLLSFSVRVKLGKWWRHTLCYQLFRKIGQFARMIWENIGFLWKVILVMLVLAFLRA